MLCPWHSLSIFSTFVVGPSLMWWCISRSSPGELGHGCLRWKAEVSMPPPSAWVDDSGSDSLGFLGGSGEPSCPYSFSDLSHVLSPYVLVSGSALERTHRKTPFTLIASLPCCLPSVRACTDIYNLLWKSRWMFAWECVLSLSGWQGSLGLLRLVILET